MATAMPSNFEFDLKGLTDCMYFINGRCLLNDKCPYRHCREAAERTQNCSRWPKKCRNVTCTYRHPAIKKKPKIPQALLNHAPQPQPQAVLPMPREGFISFFWDIENVPIPKGQRPFDIVQRIRQKLVVEPGLQEAAFSCFCNINTISQENQHSLHHATVRIVHVPDRKPGAVDRQIMLELDRFERVHRPPATAVLISGDIDFVGKLSDLRHQAGFYVIVIHNKPAKEELKATVHAHYPWELFTLQQPPINVANNLDSVGNDHIARSAQSNRMRPSTSNNNLRRRDSSSNRPSGSNSVVRRREPSLNRPLPSNRQQPIANIGDIKKHQCPKCPCEFDSIQGLRQHQNAKKHLFNCPVCNESFVQAVGQTQHQKDKSHYVLDYKCNQCNRYFAKIESLNQHQQATGHIPSSMQTPSPSFLLGDHGNNDDDEHHPDIIILQGIEVLKQYYLPWLLRNQ